MSKKKNGNKRKRECIGIAVLKGLEEQRRKNELLNGAKVNGDSLREEGVVVKEVAGFYYDMERKRYFPNEMKKERRKESEWFVKGSMNVLELIFGMKEGKRMNGMKELLNRLCFESRVWKRVDPVSEGSIHGVYMNNEWIWLGYHGCVVRISLKNEGSELIRECMGGELVCVNEGICVLNNGMKNRVYDLLDGRELMYREEVLSGCHCKWNDKECMMICGNELYIEMEDEKKRIRYPVGYVCSCITKCCICGFRNGKILEWSVNEWKEICGLRGCIKRLVYERDCVCGCDVFGNGVICVREREYWNSVKIGHNDIEDICILNEMICCLIKNGNVICMNESGDVLKEMRMEMKGKWICGRNEKCVIVNDKGNVIWSN